jgi:uncharacterized protein
MDKSPAPSGSDNSLVPVEEKQRFLTLDVLRGLAVLGILLANILDFGYSEVGATGEAVTEFSAVDSIVLFCVGAFVDSKFFSIFSMLFGIGLALQYARAKSRGRPFIPTYRRRLGILLVFGIAHGVLLLATDILAFYAVIGFVALLFRRATQKTLILSSVALLVLSLPVLVSLAVKYPDLLTHSEPDWDQLARERRVELNLPEGGALGDSNASPRDHELRFYAFMADKQRIFSSGSWTEMTFHRTATFFLVVMPLRFCLVTWRCLALFLLGIFFYRKGWFLDSDRDRGVYWGMVVGGFVLGLLLQGIAMMALSAGSLEDPATAAIFLSGVIIGPVGLALAYSGGTALFCLNKGWRRRLQPLASTGRMALTNYLGQSVICGFLFYSYGLRLYDSLSPSTVEFLALLIFSFQVVFSSIWLRQFRFGPFEWVWRRLTYRKIQPMRRLSTKK